MNILFTSGRETEYIRNKIVLQLMIEFANVKVILNSSSSITFNTLKSFYAVRRLDLKEFLIWAGFLGQGIALALAASRFERAPIVLDAYVSLYDTLCEDRLIVKRNSLSSYLIYYLEKLALMKSNLIVTDTLSNANFFIKKFNLNSEKVRKLYVGCDESLFTPIKTNKFGDTIEVFTYNSFLNLHGNEVIVQAAEKISRNNKNIKFIIGGSGKNFNRIVKYALERKVENVKFIGWIPMQALPAWIARADICLGGHFAALPKSARVIPTKAFQFIAMQKPTILGDGEGNRELFTHGVNSYLTPLGDSDALAEAIAVLADAPKQRDLIAEGGRALFEQRLSKRVLTCELQSCLQGIQL